MYSRVFIGAWLVWVAILVARAWGGYHLGDYNDDVVYVALARSLSQGSGYVNIAAASDLIHQRFPPAYPMTLVPAQWLAPDCLSWLRVQSVLAGLASILVSFAYCRRLGMAVPWVAILLGLNPSWLVAMSTVMSEPLFMIALLLYMLRIERLLLNPSVPVRARDMVFTGLAAALCYYLRAPALVLLPTTCMCAWQASKLRYLPPFLAAYGLAVGPYQLSHIVSGYDGQLGVQSALLKTFVENLPYWPRTLLATLLGDPHFFYPWLPVWLAAPALLVMLAGLWTLRRRSAGFWWVLFSLALLLVWPFQTARLGLFCLPFLALGLWAALNRVRKGLGNWLPGLLVVSNLAVLATPPSGGEPVDPQLLQLLQTHRGSQRLATSQLKWWLESGARIYSVSQEQCFGLEWQWLAALYQYDVGLVLLDIREPGDARRAAASFQRRPYLYKAMYQNANQLLVRFQPDATTRRAWALQALARNCMQQRDFSSAIRLFEGAQKVAPYEISSKSGLAWCLLSAGQQQPATQLVAQVLQIDPDCGEALRLQQILQRFAR